MSNARKFSPIFPAPVTPLATPTFAQTSKGVEYARFRATVGMSGGLVERTVMAFGAQLDQVRDLIAEGREVNLAVQHDGGTLRVIGLPREREAA